MRWLGGVDAATLLFLDRRLEAIGRLRRQPEAKLRRFRPGGDLPEDGEVPAPNL